MEKYNWKDDTFLRVSLADTGKAPVAVKEKRFEKSYTLVIKRKHGISIRKTVPEWVKDIAIKAYENMLDVEMVCELS